MSNSYQTGEMIGAFNQQFEDVTLSHKAIRLNKGLIHTFFIKTPSKDSLGNNWRKLSNFIALHFQKNLENEFERWNIYLFFLNAQGISNELKYKIENDTFSSRKIVIDDETDQNSIIKNYILNDNLRISKENAKVEDDCFQPNTLVWELLKDKTLKKINITSEAERSFNQLIIELKKEDHEI